LDQSKYGVSSWIFLKDGKPAFLKRPPTQNGWFIDIVAAHHVWRTVKKAGFKYLETRNLNQDPLENTLGAICLYCGSNSNPTVGQFVGALKTSIISGLAFVVCMTLAVRLRVQLFWLTYTPCLGLLLFLLLILPQVTEGKTLIMFVIVPMLQRKCSRNWVLLYVQVTWKYSELV